MNGHHKSEHDKTHKVDPVAPPGAVEAAYRRLGKMYPPDLNHAENGRPTVHGINEAHTVLQDPVNRKAHNALQRVDGMGDVSSATFSGRAARDFMRKTSIRLHHTRQSTHAMSAAVAQPEVLFLTDNLAEAEVHSFVLRREHIQARTMPFSEICTVEDVSNSCGLIVFELSQAISDLPSKVHRIASRFSGPVLLVTYERDERYQLAAYEAGIAECITKPIGTNLLLAKILAWLKQSDHANRSQEGPGSAAGFKLHSDRRLVRTPEGNVVRLSDMEFRLLQILVGSQGRILDSGALTEQLWGEYDRSNGMLLKSLVYRARQKIEVAPADPQHIITVPGHGYMLSTRSQST